MKNKIEIRHIDPDDKGFWKRWDTHLPDSGFDQKVRDKQGYVLSVKARNIGLLRYNLFWDNTPFCTMLYILEKYRGNGYGKALMEFWESEMQSLGYHWLLVSTQSDETAQHFYRKLGYRDCGGLLAPGQPMELFLSKNI